MVLQIKNTPYDQKLISAKWILVILMYDKQGKNGIYVNGVNYLPSLDLRLKFFMNSRFNKIQINQTDRFLIDLPPINH